MATLHLTENETRHFTKLTTDLVATVRRICIIRNRRFGQIVAADGRILKCVEVELRQVDS